MKATTAYACTWFATVIGVIAGMIITKSAWCLWAMFIPAFISAHFEDKENNTES